MDAQLDLATSLPQLAAPSKETATVVDLSPYACPLHYIKARNELRKVAPGGVVEFIVMPGEPLQQVSSSLADDGHEIIAVEEARAPGLLKVRRSSQAL
jgi:TusA-related sulfurtransferase